MNYSFVSGAIIDSEKASVSIFDRGLILGDGLFETVKAVRGIPEFFSDHFQRLSLSSQKLFIAIPYDELFFRNLIRELCEKNRLSEATVRITITRGISSGLSIDPTVAPTVIVTAQPIAPLSPELYAKGVPVAITSVKRSSASGIDGHIKTTNYLANIIAKAEADKRGAYEGIFLGEKGDIAEMTTASFFCVIEGALCTPPLDADILPGITRQQVLRGAYASGIAVKEAHIFPHDLTLASEAFLTSSVRAVMPISSVDTYTFPPNGPITKKVIEYYQKMVDADHQKYDKQR